MGRIVKVSIQTPVVSGNVGNRKLLFISLGSPLVALERDIFKLTKGCLINERKKLKLNQRVTTCLASKYVRRDVTLEGESCNTDLF